MRTSLRVTSAVCRSQGSSPISLPPRCMLLTPHWEAPVTDPRLVSAQKPPLGAVPEPSEGHLPGEAAADPENWVTVCSTL